MMLVSISKTIFGQYMVHKLNYKVSHTFMPNIGIE